jgi:hypothetical protein
MKINWKLATVAFSAATFAAFADCPDGVRNTTPAEQAFETATLETLSAMVPAPPPGWEVQKQQIYKTARTSVCKGTDPSRIVYTATYDWVDGRKEMAARTEAMQKKMADIRRMPVETEAEYSELGKQARALRRDAAKARALRNLEEGARLEAEAKVLETKAFKIKEAHTSAVTPKIMEAMKEFQTGEDGRSYSMSLLIAANETPGRSQQSDTAEFVAGPAKPLPAKLQVQNVVVRWRGNKEHLPLFSPLLDRTSATAKLTR